MSGSQIGLLGVAFVLAGVGIGCAETAEHAAVAAFAPEQIRGSAFGLLATVLAIGNIVASVAAGLLHTLASPTFAFGYLAAWMILALTVLLWTARKAPDAEPAAPLAPHPPEPGLLGDGPTGHSADGRGRPPRGRGLALAVECDPGATAKLGDKATGGFRTYAKPLA